jgi:nucleoside-triphosphatase THEP1
MIKRPLTVFGGKGKGQNNVGSASAATPDNIEDIGKPAIHLISGATGVGKSNVARNMVQAWWEAHAKANTSPTPEVLVYTGAGGDPVWAGANPKHIKMFTPQTAGEFVDEVNRRYDRAIRAKTTPASGKEAPVGTPGEVASSLPNAAPGAVENEKHRPAMVVVDDAGSSELFPAQMFRSPIAQAIQSHRHADLSFIVSSQRYHSHNPWLRNNAATVNVFPPKGAEEVNFLKRDLPIPQESLRRGFAVAAANGKHNFISVDTRERVATHGFTGHPI